MFKLDNILMLRILVGNHLETVMPEQKTKQEIKILFKYLNGFIIREKDTRIRFITYHHQVKINKINLLLLNCRSFTF